MHELRRITRVVTRGHMRSHQVTSGHLCQIVHVEENRDVRQHLEQALLHDTHLVLARAPNLGMHNHGKG